MYQQIHHLIETGVSSEEILSFNFEDERIAGMDTEHLDIIKRCYEEMYSHRPIFFLDEIQIVPHWKQFVRRLADQKFRVYVAGSIHYLNYLEDTWIMFSLENYASKLADKVSYKNILNAQSLILCK